MIDPLDREPDETPSDMSPGNHQRDEKGGPAAAENPCDTGFFPHLKPPREGHRTIEWTRPTGRSTSIRIRDYTCDCLPTIYELCAAGGRAHIRRTEKRPEGDRVTESPWLNTALTAALWHDLLEGNAR